MPKSLVAVPAVLAVLVVGCSGEADSGPDAADPTVTGSTPTGTQSPDGDGATTTPDGPDSTDRPDDEVEATQTPEVIELPRGGTEIFPQYRLFGYSGHPQAEALGRLGIGDLDERVEEIEVVGQDYLDGRELMPVLELITVVVHPTPADDGLYRTREPDTVVQTHLDAAERHDALLLLNIQPGLSTMIDEVQHYEEFLLHPSVGIALDPEWDVSPGQIPGRVYGFTEGTEIDEVAEYLDTLAEENELPQKVLVYHQVHLGVVGDPEEIGEYDNVAVVNSIDGIGAHADKVATYDRIMAERPDHVIPGFKLFFEEDAVHGPLMTPEEVLALDPEPEYILWE